MSSNGTTMTFNGKAVLSDQRSCISGAAQAR
jgi:hypothetical protein